MSRVLSGNALASMHASETSEVWLAMVELDHRDWPTPIRLVRNTETIISNGDTYLPFPFDVSLPDEEAEQTAVVNWVALNASNELIEELRAVTGPIDGRVFWVLASDPDVVELGPLDLQIRVFEYDSEKIKGTMVIEPILDAVFGSLSMDGVNTPGLF